MTSFNSMPLLISEASTADFFTTINFFDGYPQKITTNLLQ